MARILHAFIIVCNLSEVCNGPYFEHDDTRAGFDLGLSVFLRREARLRDGVRLKGHMGELLASGAGSRPSSHNSQRHTPPGKYREPYGKNGLAGPGSAARGPPGSSNPSSVTEYDRGRVMIPPVSHSNGSLISSMDARNTNHANTTMARLSFASPPHGFELGGNL